MPTYTFAHTAFLNGSEIEYLAELVGYLRGAHGTIQSIERLDLTGTDFAADQTESIQNPADILRVVITGSVEAERSDNTLHGGIPAYFGSAQDKVEQESFAYSDGWDIGFTHLLNISEVPDVAAAAHYSSHLLNGQDLPAPTHVFTAEEIAQALAASV